MGLYKRDGAGCSVPVHYTLIQRYDYNQFAIVDVWCETCATNADNTSLWTKPHLNMIISTFVLICEDIMKGQEPAAAAASDIKIESAGSVVKFYPEAAEAGEADHGQGGRGEEVIVPVEAVEAAEAREEGTEGEAAAEQQQGLAQEGQEAAGPVSVS